MNPVKTADDRGGRKDLNHPAEADPSEKETAKVLLEWDLSLKGMWVFLLVAVGLVLIMFLIESPWRPAWIPASVKPWMQILSWVFSLIIGGLIFMAVSGKRRYVVTDQGISMRRRRKDEAEEIYAVAWTQLKSFSVTEKYMVFYRDVIPQKHQRFIVPADMEKQMILIEISMRRGLMQVGTMENVGRLWWEDMRNFFLWRIRQNVDSVRQSEASAAADAGVITYNPSVTEPLLWPPIVAAIILAVIFYYLPFSFAGVTIIFMVITFAAIYALSRAVKEIVVDGPELKVRWRTLLGRVTVKEFHEAKRLQIVRRRLPWPRWELELTFEDRTKITITTGRRRDAVQQEGAKLQNIIRCEFMPLGI